MAVGPGRGRPCGADRRRSACRRSRCCASKYRMIGGIVSAGWPPTSRIDRGLGDVVERKRQAAIDAEGARRGGRRRRHAEPAVVVDVGGAERDARELAEQIGLLVGQRAAAEARRPRRGRIAPGRRGALGDTRRAPRPRSPARARRLAADERRAQALGMSERRGRGPALDAQAALVDRELRVARATPECRRSSDSDDAFRTAVRSTDNASA